MRDRSRLSLLLASAFACGARTEIAQPGASEDASAFDEGAGVSDAAKDAGVCGTFAGIECSDPSLVCVYGPHECFSSDVSGHCVPAACSIVCAPVCACSGKTYCNECFAAVAGETIDHDGPCQ